MIEIDREENDANQSLIIYPNPSSGSFTIQGINQNIDVIRIFDVTGRIVFEQVVEGTQSIQTELPAGYYQVVSSGMNNQSIPLIVK